MSTSTVLSSRRSIDGGFGARPGPGQALPGLARITFIHRTMPLQQQGADMCCGYSKDYFSVRAPIDGATSALLLRQ